MAPVPDSANLRQVIDKYIRSSKIMVFSNSTDPYCTTVKVLLTEKKLQYSVLELDKLENGRQMEQTLCSMVGRTSLPQVFVNSQHLGGCDETITANAEGRLDTLMGAETMAAGSKHEYDLIVIGGGSGGLSASKTAANYYKKVAVLDYIVPTPLGTTWGLGGTCVNVGCIPKKLMHRAANLGHAIQDATQFGWQLPEKIPHNWETMRKGIQNHIKSLNWGYRVQLREKKVEYLNSHAFFVDAHTIKAKDKKGNEKTMTAERFLIATGERPRYPDIPGAKEFGITSDDLFSLPYPPGKTLVVGASYVALECAGFLAGIGFDVTIMVRSILLRGFDQDMAKKVGDYMVDQGIKFIRPCVPTQVVQLEAGKPGRLKVVAKMTDKEEIVEGEYNTVLFAIGRFACTSGIGLETIGVNINPKNGRLPAVNEQTNVPHIFAIGDVLDGKPELTPVAIEAGMLLANRLYGGSNLQCDYLNVPTTVFTPLEYGAIGYSEEDAIKKFGEDKIDVYHSSFTPLEWTVPHREDNICYVKLICLIPENEKIIGFHYFGPDAGEVTQGFVLGIKLGATKAQMDAVIGIHPTCAEIFTTLTITKRSGGNVMRSGC